MILVALAFAAVAAQLIHLALPDGADITASLNEVVDGNFARPDIVDRNGRLLATDVEAYSLFADPAHVLDRDEVVEKLATVFTDLDQVGPEKGSRQPLAPIRVDPPRAVAADGASRA